jgi:hypothetical protein
MDENETPVEAAPAEEVALVAENPEGEPATAEEVGAEPLVPKGFFALEVAYRKGTTEGEIEAAMSFIKEFTESLAESKEDHFPLCIDALTIKRDR